MERELGGEEELEKTNLKKKRFVERAK